MSKIKLDLDNQDQGTQMSSNRNLPNQSNFLANISLHNVAKVFADLSRQNRVLVIPIGFPQAGKSLLISSLMYYARKGKETLFRTNIERDFPYDKGHMAVDSMVDFFDQGKLYDPTQKGTLDLIGINITPTTAKRPLLKLAFLDLAGEDIKSIKTSERGEFTEKINAVFNGLKIDNSPIIFTLITPFIPVRMEGESLQNAHDREDALHYDFLNYVQQNQPQLLKNTKFFVIVSQWDKNPNENDSVENYIQEFRPSIYNYVKKSSVIWGNYSVGKLLETPENGIIKQEIVRINYAYPSRFWKKLYHICTNQTLESKTWWEKLLGA